MDNVLDHAVLDELLSFADDGDPELLVDLIQMFLEDGPSKVEAVSQGLAVGDFDMAERAAHSLKGSSEQLQISTRAHELETSRKLAPMLKENYAVAEDALKQVLAQYQ